MPKVKFKSRLLADGHLYCPHRIVEDLKLQIGSQLEVVVEKETDRPSRGLARNFISLRNSIPELSAITETELQKTKKLWNSKIDGFVKSLKNRISVIPVKTGIQYFQTVKIKMDSRLRGNDDFLRVHQY